LSLAYFGLFSYSRELENKGRENLENEGVKAEANLPALPAGRQGRQVIFEG
jgi:hypothetical protein